MKIYAERNAKRPAAKHYQEDRCHQNENKVVRLQGGGVMWVSTWDTKHADGWDPWDLDAELT